VYFHLPTPRLGKVPKENHKIQGAPNRRRPLSKPRPCPHAAAQSPDSATGNSPKRRAYDRRQPEAASLRQAAEQRRQPCDRWDTKRRRIRAATGYQSATITPRRLSQGAARPYRGGNSKGRPQAPL
jgi:hypothetical protein